MDKTFIFKSIFAGISIGLAGCVYLNVGGVIGACLFAFGLLAVVSLGLNLFTGKAQFVWYNSRVAGARLLTMLVLNFAGCMIVASITDTPELSEKAAAIIDLRLAKGPLRCGLLSLFCGMIMTTAVQGAAKNNWLPLLFGVPLFILCGLPHCVADAFYISAAGIEYISENLSQIIAFYICIVAGNYLGCNFYRFFAPGAHDPIFDSNISKEPAPELIKPNK